ncbi:flagellar hook-associated protein FlgK [Sphingomonas canadensis]|uniref:Flagellar hook-associated protein 1 n=1 Tax=Sphingomonas canadensis TaxID=1219257 RepID=A0ABW3H4H4_9SPHN|nr:flagellar hook-associated protein FlgK [Sphingomonas canadensis]MCW3834850.1 flagellar hook-associated protein FlgK [Sphingomonas canadensis]
MSDLLSIGASGVRAYQTALTTVSENIANAGAAGYSRRTANVREISAPGSPVGTGANGLGVSVLGVNRAADQFRSAEVRTTSADLARTEAGVTWLERIESALTAEKLGDQLTSFFGAARTLAADPSSLPQRAAMLEAASSVASAFTATGEALASAAAELEQATDVQVDQLNGIATALARVNSGIGRSAPGSGTAAAQLDERDRLLESLSAITDANVSFDAVGRVTVRLGGSNGPALVHGEQSGTVTAVFNEEGAASFALHLNGETRAFSPAAGALSGAAEGAQRIADARASLNALASDFVTGINQFQASGRDLNGTAGAPMFEAGDPPTRIAMVLTDPRGIAAAAVGGGTRDNSNLTALESLRSSAGYEAGLSGLVSANASALSARRSVADAQTAIRDGAVAARDAVSGVNVDEEAVDLIRFQQAYQASARVIQVARETLQAMLEIR